MDQYYFMNNERILFTFSHELTVEGNKYTLGELTVELSELPTQFSITGYNELSLYSWVETRVAPVGRNHMKAVLQAVNLQNKFYVLLYCHGLSLNDTFWVKSVNDTVTFKDINLYDNSFDEALGWIAFTGLPSNISRNLSTPEFTTEGALPKFWQKLSTDDIILCKGGTEGYANAGGEPFSEVVAYLIAKWIGINSIEYTMDSKNNKPVSISKLFTTKDFGLITMNDVLRNHFKDGLKVSFTRCRDLIEDILGTTEPLYDMCFFDWLIKNDDRHLNNWGFSMNNSNRKIEGFSILWDNGMSLLWSAMKQDFPEAYNYNNLFASFNIPYDFVLLCDYRKKYCNMANTLLFHLNNKDFQQECQKIFNGYENQSWKIPYLEEMLRRRCHQYLDYK